MGFIDWVDAAHVRRIYPLDPTRDSWVALIEQLRGGKALVPE